MVKTVVSAVSLACAFACAAEGVTDIYGNQRIYNGTTDIGASEAFWPLGMAIIIK